jgi:redox-sensitive bicupin YhaK (pirin superfamily)
MNKKTYKADQRGHYNHGWLEAHHSFSFASYYDPKKMGFGLLRVLNDDIIMPGEGFGAHGHDNMEIITLALKGALEHKDSMGHIQVIHPNEVQVMSAGSGITHSEYNHSLSEEVNSLQIWILPNTKNVEPRYDQKAFTPAERKNKIQELVSPIQKNGDLWIHQNSWISRIDLNRDKTSEYKIHRTGNGVYIFVIEGEVEIEGELLEKRDAIGIYDTESINLKSTKDSDILFLEVPLR